MSSKGALGAPAQLEAQYEVLACLRSGGRSSTYQVRHRSLGDLRVVRVLAPSLVAEGSTRERFIQEARAFHRLEAPQLARLWDFHIDAEGNLYLEMEHVGGVSFERLIAAHAPLSPGLALEIGSQAFAALGVLHGAGLNHLGLGPADFRLLRSTEDRSSVTGGALVKLVDLGLAASPEAESEALETGIHLTQLLYVAPEQLSASGTGSASDLYVLALMVYELLTGRHPIAGGKPSSLVAGHLFRDPLAFDLSDPEGRVPVSVRDLLLSCLAKDRSARPENAPSVSRALGAASRNLGFEARELEEILRELEAPGGITGGQGGAEEQDLSARIERAGTAAAAGDLAKALEILRAAVHAYPQERGLRRLLLDTEKAAKRDAAETRRRREIDELVRRGEALLSSGDSEGAWRLLENGRGSLGADPAWRALERRLHGATAATGGLGESAALVRRRRRERAEELCRQALELRDQGQLRPAQAKVRQAVELSMARSVRQAAVAVEAAVASAEAPALPNLPTAEPPPPPPGVGTLGACGEARTVEEVSQADEETRQRLAEALVAEAETLSQVENLDGAKAAAEQALGQVPESKEAESLLLSISSAMAANEHLGDAELDRTLSEIRERLGAGRLPEAMALLNRGLARFGEKAQLLELRYRLAREILAAELPQTREHLRPEPPLAAPAPRGASASASQSAPPATAVPSPVAPTRPEEASPVAQASPASSESPVIPESLEGGEPSEAPASLDELTLRTHVPPVEPPSEARSPSVQPAQLSRRQGPGAWKILLLLLLALALGVAVGFFL